MKEIKDLLNGILDSVISEENRDIPPLFSSWKEVAGEDCAAHSRIIDYVDGILVIGVDHPGWTQIILSRRKRILSGLRKRFPRQKIESIRMVLKEKGTDEWSAAAMPAVSRSAAARPAAARPAVSQSAAADRHSGAAAEAAGDLAGVPAAQPSGEPADREGFDNLLSRLGKAIEERDRER